MRRRRTARQKPGRRQSRSSAPKNRSRRNLQPFQGTWNFGACESVLWYAELEEIQKTWRWAIQGQEITWTRPGKETVKLSFTVDPSKSPNQIDLTFLDGPDKGEECRGIYEFERGNLWICMTEPGAKVPRPEKMAMSSTSKTALIILQDKDKKPTVGAIKAGKAPPQIVGTEKPVVTDLWPLQGTCNFEDLHSQKWTAAAEEVRAWQWTIQGQEITWTRPGKEAVRLSFTLDPSKSPPQIDLTFLDGPDKGEKCRGVYLASRHEVLICFQDPGANVDRPKFWDPNLGATTQRSHWSLRGSRRLPRRSRRWRESGSSRCVRRIGGLIGRPRRPPSSRSGDCA